MRLKEENNDLLTTAAAADPAWKRISHRLLAI
jgi:hypothetical protein